jgi:hypothetical protein
MCTVFLASCACTINRVYDYIFLGEDVYIYIAKKMHTYMFFLGDAVFIWWVSQP